MFEFTATDVANSLLIEAADNGTLADVEKALAAGANLHTLDSDGANMLLRAALENPRHEVSVYLADKGLSLVAKADLGTSPLHAFSVRGWTDLMQRALDAGAPVDAHDGKGYSPIQHAVQKGTPEAVALLAKNGADLLQSHSGFGNLLDMASAQNCAVLVELGVPVDRSSAEEQTPLHRAAYWGEADKVTVLLALGAQLEPATSDGMTPLLMAAMNGKPDCVALLLEAGANQEASARGYSLKEACETQEKIRTVVDAYRARVVMQEALKNASTRKP